MIGNDYSVGAILHSKCRIFGDFDAFDNDIHVSDLNATNNIPGQGRISKSRTAHVETFKHWFGLTAMTV